MIFTNMVYLYSKKTDVKSRNAPTILNIFQYCKLIVDDLKCNWLFVHLKCNWLFVLEWAHI